MVARLDNYNPGTLSEDPIGSRDLLKKLYQQLFPKSVRHDLGEYYTPDWLAEHVLSESTYNGDPDKRLLDPACGSGTFLVMAINRIRKWYEEHREQCRFGENDLCRKILSNVIGFDLNPLAVMASRTNYLIAIRDFIGLVDKIEIPVYLCDSITTPTEYGDLFTGTGKAAKVPCSACKPPHLVVPKEIATNSEFVAKYAKILEHCISVGLPAEEFIKNCLEESLPIAAISLHKNLYKELIALEKANKNGVWARIIKNAFAPLFVGRFDFVVGNPPWVNWEHLPSDYRELSAAIWKQYKLIGPVPFKKRQSSEQSKTDVSILMTYVAADKYLNNGCKLGFVITRTVFQSELGAWHFRAFRLPQNKPFQVLKVHDLDRVKPFHGQAANITSTFILQVGKETSYPVPWFSFRPKPGLSIDEDTSYTHALTQMERREWVARPINPKDKQSSWIFGDSQAIDVLFRLIAPSFYSSYTREGINTRGANGVYFVDAWSLHGKLFIRNRPQDGDDENIKPIEYAVEPDYVFPLLRGKDVQRWTANPSSFAIVPHDMSDPSSPVLFSRLPGKTQEFLVKFKAKLQKRRTFRNFDPSGPNWHGLYSILNATFSPYKVVWREMAAGSIAAIASDAKLPSGESKVVIPDHKLFIIPCESLDEALFVCGVFNSSIASYLIQSYAIATGISTHVLERLPIPKFDQKKDLHKGVVAAARDCMKSAEDGRELTNGEMKLDDAVAKTFKISEADLKLIRRALKDLNNSD